MTEPVMQVVGLAHSPRYVPRVIEWLRKNVRPGQTVAMEVAPSDIFWARQATIIGHVYQKHPEFWRQVIAHCDTAGINVTGFGIEPDSKTGLLRFTPRHRSKKRLADIYKVPIQERFHGRHLALIRPDVALGGSGHTRSLVARLKRIYGVPARSMILMKLPSKHSAWVGRIRRGYAARQRKRGIDVKKVEAAKLARRVSRPR